jgi:hypothetical protein
MRRICLFLRGGNPVWRVRNSNRGALSLKDCFDLFASDGTPNNSEYPETVYTYSATVINWIG